MNIKEIKISELKVYENNPRYNDVAVDKVAASIKEFGFDCRIKGYQGSIATGKRNVNSGNG